MHAACRHARLGLGYQRDFAKTGVTARGALDDDP